MPVAHGMHGTRRVPTRVKEKAPARGSVVVEEEQSNDHNLTTEEIKSPSFLVATGIVCRERYKLSGGKSCDSSRVHGDSRGMHRIVHKVAATCSCPDSQGSEYHRRACNDNWTTETNPLTCVASSDGPKFPSQYSHTCSVPVLRNTPNTSLSGGSSVTRTLPAAGLFLVLLLLLLSWPSSLAFGAR